MTCGAVFTSCSWQYYTNFLTKAKDPILPYCIYTHASVWMVFYMSYQESVTSIYLSIYDMKLYSFIRITNYIINICIYLFIFPSSRLVAVTRLKNRVYPIIYPLLLEEEMGSCLSQALPCRQGLDYTVFITYRWIRQYSKKVALSEGRRHLRIRWLYPLQSSNSKGLGLVL